MRRWKASDLPHLENMYNKALETRNFEIDNFNKRSNFSLVLQAGLFAAYGSALSRSLSSPEFSVHVALWVICFAGAFLSLSQIAMSAGAKFWQNRWEAAVVLSEMYLGDAVEDVSFQMKSPSRDSSNFVELFFNRRNSINDAYETDARGLPVADRNGMYVERDPELRLRKSIELNEEYLNKLVRKTLSVSDKSGFAALKNKFVNWLVLRKFSVSRWPIYLGFALFTIWVALTVLSLWTS